MNKIFGIIGFLLLVLYCIIFFIKWINDIKSGKD
jgi:hypothetical protein